MTLNQVNYSSNTNRGLAQPESAEEKRRRLHREAAEDVKAYAAALKEAKKRYQDYDAAMNEAPADVAPAALERAGAE